MKFGSDGTLYLLEYGSSSYRANKDASLKRITYEKGKAKPRLVNKSLTEASNRTQQ